jgi:hypothetical protein
MATYREVLPGLSPTHWWKLDETSTANPAVDEIGTSHGSYVGSPVVGQASLIGEGSSVSIPSGSSNYIQIPSHADWRDLPSLSFVALWMWPTVPTGDTRPCLEVVGEECHGEDRPTAAHGRLDVLRLG